MELSVLGPACPPPERLHPRQRAGAARLGELTGRDGLRQITVLRSNGPKATAYGVHGATAAVLLATAALLST